MERAVILCDGDTIHTRHLNLSLELQAAPVGEAPLVNPEAVTPAVADVFDQLDLSGTLGEAVRRMTAEVERRKVGRALRDAGGDKARAAEALQISYKALLQKQREHGLTN